ncbi:MAG: D-sedoheptulose-7-phosphate isomerase, partial [Catonella sp.]|uniref:D-sedoheptulose-7-phosphate isomerase n=1 Tax=Catonella sp. TaxID=2382125 RepID=UPI003F9FE98E
MDYLNNLIERYPVLKVCKDDINNAYDLLKEMYNNRGKALICGNGGSAADSDHIVGELMKGFYKKRPISGELKAKLGELSDKLQMPLRAISLTNHIALSTAFMNDVAPEMIYAQQVLGYGDMGDCLIAISTSGNSKNVVNAIKTAKALG